MKQSLLSGFLFGPICTDSPLQSKAISKYLIQYAEPEAKTLEPPENSGFNRCLVIPVFSETTDFIRRILSSWPTDEQLLITLVINRPDPCASDALQKANACLKEITEVLPQVILGGSPISWRKATDSGPSFLLVDRCSELPIPIEQGVGLARKIGCDIALKLYADSVLKTDWVYTTDADAYLPNDYFDCAPSNCSAAIFPHLYRQAEAKLQLATTIYDSRNRQYQEGLQDAGSPYGFNPTGSLLVLHLPSYAEVRGFPKRAGGEDFYILNKLQKVSCVRSIQSTPIELECRVSDRVPFGTGPAVAKLLDSKHPENEQIFYHPKCFWVLKTGYSGMKAEHPQKWLNSVLIPTEFQTGLKRTNIESAQRHLSPLFEQDGDQYLRHLDMWFDAFLTLKTIHYLRDSHFGRISYSDWLTLKVD